MCLGETWFCDQWEWIMAIFHQPSGLNMASYLPWAIVFKGYIWHSSPGTPPEELPGGKHVLSNSLLCLSLPMAGDPQAEGVRSCQDEAQGNAASLGVFTSAAVPCCLWLHSWGVIWAEQVCTPVDEACVKCFVVWFLVFHMSSADSCFWWYSLLFALCS